MNRKAFTVIELTVAIGIIVVLMGIAIAGLRYANAQSRANSTRVTMENLKSMLAEYETQTKFTTWPAQWYKPATGAAYPYTSGDPVNFWLTSDCVPFAAGGTPVALVAPALVTADAQTLDRTGYQVLNSMFALRELMRFPAVASMVGKLPPAQLMSITDGTWGITGQVMLDGWGNPILFVSGNGGLLLGAAYNAARSYVVGDYVLSGGTSYRCILGSQHNAPPNTTYWQPMPAIVAPNNRPFFASAGPDGDFSKGDDNIYSFEQ